MTLQLKGSRKRYVPKDTDEITCETHGTITTWGALDGIQQMAVEAGLDTSDELPCLLSPSGN